MLAGRSPSVQPPSLPCYATPHPCLTRGRRVTPVEHEEAAIGGVQGKLEVRAEIHVGDHRLALAKQHSFAPSWPTVIGVPHQVRFSPTASGVAFFEPQIQYVAHSDAQLNEFGEFLTLIIRPVAIG